MSGGSDTARAVNLARRSRLLQRASTVGLWVGGVAVVCLAVRGVTTGYVFVPHDALRAWCRWGLSLVALGSVVSAFAGMWLRGRAYRLIGRLSPGDALGPLLQSVRTGDPVIRYAASKTLREVLIRATTAQIAELDEDSRRSLREILLGGDYEDLTLLQTATIERLRENGDLRDASALREFARTRATDPDKVRVRRLATDTAYAIEAREAARRTDGLLVRPADAPIGPERLLVRPARQQPAGADLDLVRPAHDGGEGGSR